MGIIKKIRRFFVIMYANNVYKRNVKQADKLWKKYRTRFYVALDLSGRTLSIFSRKGFRRIKRDFYKMQYSESVLKVKEGAFYHTPDAGGKGSLLPAEKEARRIAFINYTLMLSDKKKRR